jgi:parvulin-like peptidyl-prolyl isomerase
MRFGIVFGSLCALAACVAVRYCWGPEDAGAESPRRPATIRPSRAAPPVRSSSSAAPNRKQPRAKIVATVNGEDITREALAKECLRHYGAEVLESLVNKYLIKSECKKQKITVTQQEVSAEIERMATRFSIPVSQWVQMLEQERGITPKQYANDIIWPTLALRKIAGHQLQVSQDELRREYEARYGEAVKVRLIALADPAEAQRILAKAKADPDSFGQLAKEHSIDVPSAAANGLIQPIRRHAGHERIEKAAFAMAAGEISGVLDVDGQFVILLCEGRVARSQTALEQVKMELVEKIRDRKLRSVAHEVFRKLQENAQVVNVFNDPVKRREMPGIAAVINGQKITVGQLAEACIDRHGVEVLEGTINRLLVEQACRNQNIPVTDEDLDQEIAQAAAMMVKNKPDGSADVDAWLELVTEQQNVSVDVYRRDSVWPSVALKKLVGNNIEVTDDDLKKGYEANYGPRVRCLAIVLNNQRQALKVWEMARSELTEERFGDLAEEYSVEPTSRALRGEVPPIQMHGGQPTLEERAFALKKGELSDIIQVGPEQYVILLCMGRTEPTAKIDFEAVKKFIYEDIYEKKQRVAMADTFDDLQRTATIDNYLAGTVHSPAQAARIQTAAQPRSAGGTTRR